jgi:hypothetical protein
MENLFPLFKKLEAHKLNHQGMYAFWLSMGAYCEASRHMGNLIPSLEKLGYKTASEQIKEIETSEKNHGISLAIAATCCIKAAGDMERATILAQDWKKTTRLFASQEAIDTTPEKEAIQLAQPCIDLFHARTLATPENAMYFLGVTYGVERLANQNIIPGEIAAFIKNGLYDLSLTQKEMGYLKEHAEEYKGAEGWHEASMKKIIDEYGDHSSIKGIQDIEKATSDWYKDLYQLISSL